MKYTVLSGAISTFLLLVSIPSFAQSTSSGTQQVNATVSSSCTVSSVSVSSARQVNPVKPDFTVKPTGTINVTCTKGTPTVTLRRDMGLNTTCQKDGLFAEELLLKSSDGSLMPYVQKLQSHTKDGVLVGTTPQMNWKCGASETTVQMDFNNASVNSFLFETSIGLVGSTNSAEAKRLYNLASAGTYSDILTFTVEF